MTEIVSNKRDTAASRNWGRLMAAAQLGDANAYRTLLSELAVWLDVYYARRLPPGMTDDTVRGVLLAIHATRHTYDPKRPFRPWLTAIARYTCVDRLLFLKSGPAEPLDGTIETPDRGEASSPARRFSDL